MRLKLQKIPIPADVTEKEAKSRVKLEVVPLVKLVEMVNSKMQPAEPYPYDEKHQLALFGNFFEAALNEKYDKYLTMCKLFVLLWPTCSSHLFLIIKNQVNKSNDRVSQVQKS